MEDRFVCAVCYNERSKEHLAVTPCCFAEGGSTHYCKACIRVICERGIQGQFGRCPTCSTLITITGDGIVQACTSVTGMCRMCCQERVLADTGNRLCDKCLLGVRYRFRYECQGCHGVQVIPHPMWLYQSSPEEFGDTSWACHLRCHSYQHWRVLPEDAPRIPPEHCPESWGRREEWLEAVRAHRQRQGGQEQAEEMSCSIS